MVLGAVFLVCFKGGGIQRIDSVHPHTPLETGGGLLAQQPLHLHLFYQIFRALVDMAKAVDFLPCQVRGGSHQVLVFRLRRQVVGCFHRMQARAQDFAMQWVVKDTIDPKEISFDHLLQKAASEKRIAMGFVTTESGERVQTYMLRTGKFVRAGDRVLSFDILTGDQLFVDRMSYHFVRPNVGDRKSTRLNSSHT